MPFRRGSCPARMTLAGAGEVAGGERRQGPHGRQARIAALDELEGQRRGQRERDPGRRRPRPRGGPSGRRSRACGRPGGSDVERRAKRGRTPACANSALMAALYPAPALLAAADQRHQPALEVGQVELGSPGPAGRRGASRPEPARRGGGCSAAPAACSASARSPRAGRRPAPGAAGARSAPRGPRPRRRDGGRRRPEQPEPSVAPARLRQAEQELAARLLAAPGGQCILHRAQRHARLLVELTPGLGEAPRRAGAQQQLLADLALELLPLAGERGLGDEQPPSGAPMLPSSATATNERRWRRSMA